MRTACAAALASIVFAHLFSGQEKFLYALPKPTGPFAVGRTMVWWTDQSRREEAVPGAMRRELGAFIYYPASATEKHADYYPGLTQLGPIPQTKILERHFGSAWTAVRQGLVRSNAYSDAPFLKRVGKCPVLVFSPGGSAPVLAYSAQLEELASQGYVVVGLEHPYDTALIIRPGHHLIPFIDQAPQQPGPPTVAGLQADLKQVVRWTEDTKFALDEVEKLSREKDSVFFGHLDLSRIGVFGHSLGGKAAARICQTDRRVKACLNQDGELFGIPFGGTQPIPSVIAEQSTLAPFVDIYVAEQLATDAQLAAVHVTRKQFDDWRSAKTEALRAFLRRDRRNSYFVTIRRPAFTHGGFMDISDLSAIIAGADASRAESNLELATRITLAFFDSRLRHETASWNQLLTSPPEGVSIEFWGKRGGS
jgi:predicted dienelactone hydrolase